MEIIALVHPRSKKEKVEILGSNHFKVHVTAPPTDGKANQAVLVILAKYLNIKKSQIALVRGEKSKRKVFEVQP